MESISFSILALILLTTIKERSSLLRSLGDREKKLETLAGTSNALSQDFLSRIQTQLDLWGLTPSEKEISLLLIKGLSLEEISRVRKTSSKTVRQHAVNIYAKSKIEGRHQLSAYFIEELLQPCDHKK
ncbi:helix-turn-helix transcriptional regulator [Pseudomonas chlororaphis]|uniref:helix-turn-helix transcriptional regulator n=1 Tax=Pseudomonas chlororaphis TaxID=587753 RepID=UPI0023652724|nr:LuxR C-terminal-related transcriptional regulator [Pseudomonas chlororaphis]WDH19987.1 LuxR C-terminal-related transcriptional regulator [Pseudomonas chlororaphis]